MGFKKRRKKASHGLNSGKRFSPKNIRAAASDFGRSQDLISLIPLMALVRLHRPLPHYPMRRLMAKEVASFLHAGLHVRVRRIHVKDEISIASYDKLLHAPTIDSTKSPWVIRALRLGTKLFCCIL